MVGARGLRPLHQQHPIFTIVKGGVSGRNGQVTLSLAPTSPLFPTFPNTLAAFPPGAVLPARDIQEISPDLENEFAWAGNIAIQRQIGPRASIEIAANMNRGQKHGFLDINQAAPVDKAALNAAMAAAPLTTVFRTVAQADATRPYAVVDNAFRRMDVLTNDGRYWYQGVRVAARHQSADLTLTASYTLSKAEDRLNHWFAPEDSSDPELDRGRTGADTPHNFVASATWDLPGDHIVVNGWRLSAVQHSQSGTPYSIRYTGNPTGTFLTQCSTRGCQAPRPGARNTERGDFINYTDMTLSRTFQVGPDRLEFRADAFNVFNNWNLTADGYVGIVGAANFGQHTGGSAVFPGRQFQFAVTYRY